MKRFCSLEEISDGNFYNINDLVQVSCDGCGGHANCCHGMGNSIVLDPFDVHRILAHLKIPFEQLLIDKIELNVVDGIILPNLKMKDTNEQCAFLNPNGRCSIHSSRPGICRIFPLGRYYENGEFKYILQVNECPNTSQTKVKLSKWIDTQNLDENQRFINDWHYFLKDVELVIKNTTDETLVKQINMYVLNYFYMKPYEESADFYNQFENRLKEAKKLISQLG